MSAWNSPTGLRPIGESPFYPRPERKWAMCRDPSYPSYPWRVAVQERTYRLGRTFEVSILADTYDEGMWYLYGGERGTKNLNAHLDEVMDYHNRLEQWSA